jgi:hypothetical protein
LIETCIHKACAIRITLLAAATMVALAACDTPGVTLVQPDVGTSRDSVVFHAQLEDSALAVALGWERGVPGVEIQFHRIVDPFRPTTVYTDSAGYARVSSPLPGLYKIAAYRVLGEHETGPTGGVVRAFGDGLKHHLSGAANLSLALASDQRGSLVISEVFDGGATHENQYFWAKFAEFYNNSDTTVYLDGMLWGQAFGVNGSSVFTCEENAPFREDPAGLWTYEFHQFPGSGTDYPAAPGEVVVVAMDAVDHSQVDPTLPDLSDADFELEGSADTDNPDVPNMPARGPRSDPRGHGMYTGAVQVVFLALPVDVISLATEVHPQGVRYVRIPSERIVDVRHGRWEDSDSDPAPRLPKYPCLNWINREFDRLESVVNRPGGDNRVALHRRPLRNTTYRTILQDLNTSRLDFVTGLYSPGRLEY